VQYLQTLTILKKNFKEFSKYLTKNKLKKSNLILNLSISTTDYIAKFQKYINFIK